ncbi:MAG: Chromosomal replication initiator protein DnaA [Microgenomates bacterium OLB23]|nr:MAG: Chromosomal replication initiator protein DnaA [Microgenomates bacterium OLB23]
MFLDGRKKIIEKHLSDFLQKEVQLEILIKPPKKKKGKKEEKEQTPLAEEGPSTGLPLIDYKDSLEGVLKKAHIQDRYTFENFAVSATNHVAHAAAQAVAENPARIYNPLFIYGDVGVGKTHLSHAIANHILQKNIQQKVLYCTSEQFTNDLVESIKVKNTRELRKKYRELDLLIIDDVQFIAGKSYVQEEFYHTFNAIVQGGGQSWSLISDRPPKEIKELEDRLRSRFSGGLILDIQKPDFELRTAILLIKAEERHIDIDIDAAKEIAEKVTDSRELEGTLLRLLSVSLMESQSNKITMETTQGELGMQAARIAQKVSPHDVIKNLCLYYQIKPSIIKKPQLAHRLFQTYAKLLCMCFVERLVLTSLRLPLCSTEKTIQP